MQALLKIEWIKTWRSWPVFIMSIGMPVGFFHLGQVFAPLLQLPQGQHLPHGRPQNQDMQRQSGQ